MDKYIFIDEENFFKGMKIIVSAVQWTGLNSHPHDKKRNRIVSPYLRRSDPSQEICRECKNKLVDHGKMKKTKEENSMGDGRVKVCPGDWIINFNDDYWACPQYLFIKIYRKIEEYG